MEGQGELRSTRKSRRQNLNCPRRGFLFRLPSPLLCIFLGCFSQEPAFPTEQRENFVKTDGKNIAASTVIVIYLYFKAFPLESKSIRMKVK